MFKDLDKNMIILGVLKENSRLSTGKISKKTGIPATTIFNRLKKMEKQGIIKKYTIEMDYKKIGIGIKAFIFISQDYGFFTGDKKDILFEEILKEPHVENIFKISGRYDFLITIRAKDIEEINEFLDKLQEGDYGILRTETVIVLKEAE